MNGTTGNLGHPFRRQEKFNPLLRHLYIAANTTLPQQIMMYPPFEMDSVADLEIILPDACGYRVHP